MNFTSILMIQFLMEQKKKCSSNCNQMLGFLHTKSACIGWFTEKPRWPSHRYLQQPCSSVSIDSTRRLVTEGDSIVIGNIMRALSPQFLQFFLLSLLVHSLLHLRRLLGDASSRTYGGHRESERVKGPGLTVNNKNRHNQARRLLKMACSGRSAVHHHGRPADTKKMLFDPMSILYR